VIGNDGGGGEEMDDTFNTTCITCLRLLNF